MFPWKWGANVMLSTEFTSTRVKVFFDF